MPGSADLASERDVSHVPTARAHGLCAVIVGKALFFFFKIVFILFERERVCMSRREREREKQVPCWAGSLTWDSWGSIPGLGDHDLSRRQLLKQLSHPGAPMES